MTSERLALQRLLTDIRGAKVDVVVVYKIDRLSPSLLDFAKLRYEAHNAPQRFWFTDQGQARSYVR